MYTWPRFRVYDLKPGFVANPEKSGFLYALWLHDHPSTLPVAWLKSGSVSLIQRGRHWRPMPAGRMLSLRPVDRSRSGELKIKRDSIFRPWFRTRSRKLLSPRAPGTNPGELERYHWCRQTEPRTCRGSAWSYLETFVSIHRPRDLTGDCRSDGGRLSRSAARGSQN